MNDINPQLYRRHVLALASGLLTATSGCLGFLGFGNDDSNSNEEDTTSDDGNGDGSPQDHHGDSQNNSTSSETESRSDNDTTENDTQASNESNETPHEAAEPEANPEADPSDHEYADPEEAQQPTQNDLTISGDALTEKNGTVGVSGLLTNKSTATIDVVDIEVTFLDANGDAIYQNYDGTNDLKGGDTWEFFIPAHGEYAKRAADYNLEIIL